MGTTERALVKEIIEDAIGEFVEGPMISDRKVRAQRREEILSTHADRILAARLEGEEVEVVGWIVETKSYGVEDPYRSILFDEEDEARRVSEAQASMEVVEWSRPVALVRRREGENLSEPERMKLICERLGFDPTNHHNAARCPYCTPNEESIDDRT